MKSHNFRPTFGFKTFELETPQFLCHLIVKEEDAKEGLGSLAPLSLSRSSQEELFKFSTDLDMASFK